MSGLSESALTVADEVLLYRRVHPDRTRLDERRGCNRLASAAFTEASHEVSIDLGDALKANGRTPESTLDGFSVDDGWGLVQISAGDARAAGAMVCRNPLDDNPCHGLVVGKLSRSKLIDLCVAARWVIRPKGACDPPHIRVQAQ